MTKADIQDILDGHKPLGGVNVARVMDVLVLLSAVAITLETVPTLSTGLRHTLLGFEIFLLSLFAVEYLLRLFTAPRPLRYALSFWGIIDLLTVAPALISLTPQWQAIRILRLLRLVRVFKLFRQSRALDRLVNAFRQVRGELMIFGLIAALVLYVAAVGIYIFEHQAQPDVFTSIPASFWWAVVSFTTVGYGDMVPITPGGRVFTTFVLFIGLGVIAVPSAIVTAALLGNETNTQRQLTDNHDKGSDEPRNSAQNTKGE